MRNLVIVYASRYGQTEKIATRIADVARASGATASVFPVDGVPDAALDSCDAAIIAGGVYLGGHDAKLARFVRANLQRLMHVRSAFVSVSGAANEKEIADGYVRKFLKKTAWTPDATLNAGGGYALSRYGIFARFMMRRIIAARGLDSSRDHEFTDWEAVEAFAREFVGGQRVKVA